MKKEFNLFLAVMLVPVTLAWAQVDPLQAAYELDGNDIVEVLSGTRGQEDLVNTGSLEFVIKLSSITDGDIVLKNTNGENQYCELKLLDGGKLFFEGDDQIESDSLLEVDVCYRISMVFSGGDMNFYVNANLWFSTGVTTFQRNGWIFGDQSQSMVGSLDDIRFWSTAIGTTQIENWKFLDLAMNTSLANLDYYFPVNENYPIGTYSMLGQHVEAMLTGDADPEGTYAAAIVTDGTCIEENSWSLRVGSATLSCQNTATCQLHCNGDFENYDHAVDTYVPTSWSTANVAEPFLETSGQSDFYNMRAVTNTNGGIHGGILPAIKNSSSYDAIAFYLPGFSTYDGNPSNATFAKFPFFYADPTIEFWPDYDIIHTLEQPANSGSIAEVRARFLNVPWGNMDLMDNNPQDIDMKVYLLNSGSVVTSYTITVPYYNTISNASNPMGWYSWSQSVSGITFDEVRIGMPDANQSPSTSIVTVEVMVDGIEVNQGVHNFPVDHDFSSYSGNACGLNKIFNNGSGFYNVFCDETPPAFGKIYLNTYSTNGSLSASWNSSSYTGMGLDALYDEGGNKVYTLQDALDTGSSMDWGRIWRYNGTTHEYADIQDLEGCSKIERVGTEIWMYGKSFAGINKGNAGFSNGSTLSTTTFTPTSPSSFNGIDFLKLLPNGNVIVVYNLSSATDHIIYLYSNSTMGTTLATLQFSSSSALNFHVMDVEYDSGNIYVSIQTKGSVFDWAGSATHDRNTDHITSNVTAYLCKLNSNLQLQWSTSLAGEDATSVNGVNAIHDLLIVDDELHGVGYGSSVCEYRIYSSSEYVGDWRYSYTPHTTAKGTPLVVSLNKTTGELKSVGFSESTNNNGTLYGDGVYGFSSIVMADCDLPVISFGQIGGTLTFQGGSNSTTGQSRLVTNCFYGSLGNVYFRPIGETEDKKIASKVLIRGNGSSQVIIETLEQCTVRVVDILGRVVFETKTMDSGGFVSLSHQGTYVLQVNGSEVHKIIVL